MLNNDDVKKIAHLTKINLSDDEIKNVKEYINTTSHMCECILKTEHKDLCFDSVVSYSDLRCDEEKPSYDTSEILKNSNKTENNCFCVPKIV